MSELDDHVPHDGYVLGTAIVEAVLWGIAGGIVTLCVGGVGCIPFAIYGWHIGTRRAQRLLADVETQDSPATWRALLPPEALVDAEARIAVREAAEAARKAAKQEARRAARPPRQRPSVPDDLHAALRELGFTAAEVKHLAAAAPPPEEAPLGERLRLALKAHNRSTP